MNNVFGLDIGTRNVVGTVGYQTDDKEFVVTAQYVREHETRAMLDGQIHDIGRVAKTIKEVKDELEKQTGQPLEEVCIAAAGRVLKTVTTHVEYEYAQESVVTGEDVHTLDLLGIEKAQRHSRRFDVRRGVLPDGRELWQGAPERLPAAQPDSRVECTMRRSALRV